MLIWATKGGINVLFLAGLLFSSCSKDLELDPESGVPPEQISEENLIFFLNGVYRESTPERDNYLINDIRGGNYTWTALSGNNSSYGKLVTGNSVDDGLSFSSSLWNYAYEALYNVNNVIAACERLGEDGEIAVIKAEAVYLRAYLYYHLVTVFGGVPLLLQNTTEDLPRNSPEEVFAQVQKDLDFAIGNARPFAETGNKRVSSEAATALKARVLLAVGDKTNAAQLAKQLISTKAFSLDNDYGAIFRNTAASKEVIFAFANLKTESNVRMSSLFWPYGTAWAGSYFVQPAEQVLNSLYDTGDARHAVNVSRVDNADGTFNMIISKYWDVQPLIVSRLSELYLICAEGLPLAEGLEYLNELRNIRGLDELKSVDIQGEDDYLELVLLERRRELFSEGFLFYDLVRTGKAIQLPNISSADQYVLPLPGAQLKLSNGVLEQNKGY